MPCPATFRPNYLSLPHLISAISVAPHCCVPIEWTDRLDMATALRFLEDARAYGIEVLGFTGGEPFLCPDFLHALCRRATALGFRYDKIMTNGVWHNDAAHLESVLGELAEAGFRGKLGLSVDKFHGSHTPKLVEFCRTARRVFDRDNILSLSYASRHPDQGLEPVRRWPANWTRVVEWSDMLRRYLLVSDRTSR